jgi:uncharacterized protein YqgV (UPF0045/DUF77 family)
MNHQVNLAIQVLPLGIPKDEAYRIVDEAIVAINSSGLKYVVSPFETVVEGPYSEVMKLVDSIQEACRTAGASEVLINMKLQRNFTEDVTIHSKTGKYT